MRRALLTLSGLQHASICIGSVAMPKFGSVTVPAARGSAQHEYNVVLGEHGRLAAEEAADDIADRAGLEGKDRAIFLARARAMDLQIPDGAVYEVPLCLRADGSVEPVAGGQGNYLVPDDAIVAGTLDMLFATPKPLVDGRWISSRSMLWTPDLKTGAAEHVAPVGRNWQARTSALLGSRWTGAEVVVPAIVFPGPGGGTWDVPMRNGQPVPLHVEELAQIETDLRALATRAEEQVTLVKAGKFPRLVRGSHCTYCMARPGCPAHVAEARALVTGQVNLAPGKLTDEQARRGADLLGPMRRTLDDLEGALKVHVAEHGPIQLDDGRQYGPVSSEKTVYSTRHVYQGLRDELDPLVGEAVGAQLADGAFGTSKDALYGALRAGHGQAGIKGKMKAAFTRITTWQVRASHQSGGAKEQQPQIVVVRGEGEMLRVELDASLEGLPPRIEELPAEVVERRWPIIVERATETLPTERWTAHYPKAEPA